MDSNLRGPEMCGAQQPGRGAFCEVTPGHEGEHRAPLSWVTYCYWSGDSYPVRNRSYHLGWREGREADRWAQSASNALAG